MNGRMKMIKCEWMKVEIEWMMKMNERTNGGNELIEIMKINENE